jgi:hypothetical protein
MPEEYFGIPLKINDKFITNVWIKGKGNDDCYFGISGI